MRFCTIAVLVTVMNSFSYVEPCQDGTCDSLAVRAILDKNGLHDISVESVSTSTINGHIFVLSLNNRNVTSLPPEIGKLNILQYLLLESNQLASLPPEIGQCSILVELNLRNNKLTSLPSEIGRLTALRKLSLGENQITNLPFEIGQLTRLNRLYLSNNKLTSLPSEIGHLNVLSELYLSDNQLTSIPPEIVELIYLRRLHLSRNQLSSLPTKIGQLINLVYLDVTENQLTSLFSEIGQLTSIVMLRLNNNRLTMLPPEIGQLTSLRELWLNNNQLNSLPPEILNLSSASSPPLPLMVEVADNRLCALPDSIEAWLDQYGFRDWRETQDCSSEGCADPDYLEYNPSAVVHNQDSCKTLGVALMFDKLETLNFQHNPFTSSLTITFPSSPGTKSLSIYTLNGTLVKKFGTTGNTIIWSVPESGVYYIRTVVDGKSVIRRIVL